MAAEVAGFIAAFDASYLLAESLHIMYGKRYELYMYTASSQLVDALTKGKQTDRKRLTVDILAVRQSYKGYEITGVGQIRRSDKTTDGSTKQKHNGVIDEVYQSGHIVGQALKWINRSGRAADSIPIQTATEAGVWKVDTSLPNDQGSATTVHISHRRKRHICSTDDRQ